MSEQPIFIITCGPTASGKASLPQKVIEHLKIEEPIGSFESILVDDLVEKNPSYSNAVENYLSDQLKTKTVEDIVKMFQNPTEDMITEFNAFYFNTRGKAHCKSDSELDRKFYGKTSQVIKQNNKSFELISCNEINNSKLKKALEEGHNIVLETQGVSSWDWLYTDELYFSHDRKPLIKQKNYQIVVAWTVVPMCNLIERNKIRAEKSVKEFIEWMDNKDTYTKPSPLPPRLPDIRMDIYKEKLGKIIKTFKEENKKLLKSCNARFLVFDNTTKISKILYDSDDICKKLRVASKAIDKYNVNVPCDKRNGNTDGSMYKRRLTRRKKDVKKKIGKKSKRHGGNNKRKTKKRRN